MPALTQALGFSLSQRRLHQGVGTGRAWGWSRQEDGVYFELIHVEFFIAGRQQMATWRHV